MDRLTKKAVGCFKYDLKDFEHKSNEFNDYDAFFVYSNAVKRLGELEDANEPRPIEEWGEDYGDCLWWSLPIEEPPYCGTPLDCNFPDYVTHFTRLVLPTESSEVNEAKKIYGNLYSDLWVSLKYTLEGSEYCKEIREEDTSPAFNSALCNKCLEKNCKFIGICVELHEMNRKNHENKEL